MRTLQPWHPCALGLLLSSAACSAGSGTPGDEVGGAGGTGGAGDGWSTGNGPPTMTDASDGGGDGGAGGGTLGEPPAPQGPAACYPGPAGDFTLCVPVVDADPAWGSEYGYPSHDSPSYQPPWRFVDLSAEDAALPISANFVISEVMQEWKGRYGVFQPRVVAKLQQIRETIGGSLNVNSGFRSPAYNASVGGVTYSRHMFGDAADMWSDYVSLTGLGNICEQLGADYVGLYSTFVHCDWRYGEPDPAFYPSAQASWTELPEHSAELDRSADGRWLAPATGFDEGEPLRQWTAFDADGVVLEEAVGETYEPPDSAARLRVRVGGHATVDREL